MLCLFSPVSVPVKVIRLNTLLGAEVPNRDGKEQEGDPGYKSTTGIITLALCIIQNHYTRPSLLTYEANPQSMKMKYQNVSSLK
jgi:hypothetical protein